MACYEVQCFRAPCEPICTPDVVPTGTVTGPYVNQTLPYRNIDVAKLMYSPQTITRQPGTYTGGAYPSSTDSPNYEPDFRIETSSLDWWRLVLLALGIVIGATIIKRL